jgi:hypothetical protein
MIKSGFNWDYVRNQPIAPRQPPYVANFAKPCATGKQLAKAIKPMFVQTFAGAKPIPLTRGE